jgi:hypothetical protein
MTAGSSTRTLAFRVTEEQYALAEELAEKAGFDERADMLREAVKVYAAAHGIAWPDAEWTKNEDRAALKIRGRKPELGD